MLMIALARELVKSSPWNSSVVTLFFCRAGEPELDNAASILRGLIWKLATNKDHLQLAIIFHESYESNKHRYESSSAIYALFSTLSAILDECPDAFLLIDALDKCNPGPERYQLLQRRFLILIYLSVSDLAAYPQRSKLQQKLAPKATGC